MRSDLALYLVTGIFLILLVLLTHWCWRPSRTAPATPKPTRRKQEPRPFAGYTHKPECELCDPGTDSPPQALGSPPPRLIFTRGRRQVDTTGQFCPQATCSSHGWVDWGHIRANGHPNGRHWRQLVCLSNRLDQALATANAGDGGWTDGAHMEFERGIDVPSPPVAAESHGLRASHD
jgi:hypothetical protein